MDSSLLKRPSRILRNGAGKSNLRWAHLANRSQLDGFELLYWRAEHKKECDYVLKKGQALVAIEVKSNSAKDTSGFALFRKLYSEHITAAFIVGPEGLPLEDFFTLDLNKLFRKR